MLIRWQTVLLLGAVAALTAAAPRADDRHDESDFRRPGPGRAGGDHPPDAEARPRPPRPPLEVALDADDDGEISAAEIAGAVKALQQLDENGDGKLTGEEFRPPFPPPPPPPPPGMHPHGPPPHDGHFGPGEGRGGPPPHDGRFGQGQRREGPPERDGPRGGRRPGPPDDDFGPPPRPPFGDRRPPPRD